MSDDKKQKGNWRLLLVGVVLGSVITVGAFWIYPLVINRAKTIKWADWTGFGETKVITKNTEKNEQGQVLKITESEQTKSGKTLWDWLELSSRLLVPFLIFIFGLQFQKIDKKKAEDNLAEEAIQAYLDNMAKLLLDKEFRKELFSNVNDKSNLLDKDNPVRNVARTQTITILRRLEGDRERLGRIIHFLRDAKLDKFILKNANLASIQLPKAALWEVNLQQAKLYKANLQEADLYQVNLQEANLYGANFQGANLGGANLQGANLYGANLQKAFIVKVRVEDVKKPNAQEKEEIEKALKDLVQVEEFLVKDLEKLTAQEIEEIEEIGKIKSACFWKEAIYIGRWDLGKGLAEPAEPHNKKYIEKLSEIIASDKFAELWEKLRKY